MFLNPLLPIFIALLQLLEVAADASGEPKSKTSDFFRFLGTELVVIALDEVSVLLEAPNSWNAQRRNWTMVAELRRAFRSVTRFHAFLTILSTAGMLKVPSSALKNDPDSRIVREEPILFQSITEIGEPARSQNRFKAPFVGIHRLCCVCLSYGATDIDVCTVLPLRWDI